MDPLHTLWQLRKSKHKNIWRHRAENSLHTHEQYQTQNATKTTWHRIWHHRHLQAKVWGLRHQTKLHFTSQTSSTKMCRRGQTSRTI